MLAQKGGFLKLTENLFGICFQIWILADNYLIFNLFYVT